MTFKSAVLPLLAALVFSAAPAVAQESTSAFRPLFQPGLAAELGVAANPPVTERIIGGKPTKNAKQWPFLVALVRSSTADNYQAQFCGASLIAKRFILTAAHCVVEITSAADVQVLVGTNNLGKGGKRVKVVQGVFHGDYNANTFDNDIAILELGANVTGITPIKVLTAAQEKTLAAAGKKTTVIGWGNRSTTGQDFPKISHQVEVPVISRNVCNSTKAYNGRITQNMFCAGVMAGGKDSCQGDSGGPLVVKDGSGKFRIQAGVVSFGDGCAQKNKPGVYTRLAVYNKWIKEAQKFLSGN